nr:MAG TPA: hypothetical protein [Caudoviricetes sp.]
MLSSFILILLSFHLRNNNTIVFLICQFFFEIFFLNYKNILQI